MKRIIRFQSTRYWFFALSGCLFLAGVLGFVLNRGFNLGVDFKAGIALQFQVAPASFSLQYTGPGNGEIDIPSGEQALTAAGDFIVTVTAVDGTKTSTPFRWADHPTVKDFTEALAAVPGLSAQIVGDPDADPKLLVPLVRPADITGNSYTLNLQPDPERGVQARIADVRVTLAPLGQFDLQAVGADRNQEFIARLEAKSDDPEFQTATQQKVLQLLGTKYGADQVILKRSDFVGPRMAQALGTQAVWLVVIALLLIQVYMAFRFKLIYAVSAVLALVHDAMVMLGFAAIFRIEIDAGTIAAILTILGYSINDTIVIFDRVRENQTLMRESGLEAVLDASVTQTLGRTFITSGATMMTVLALFILTSGSMKNFAFCMIVGIVEGTYSTVFIASPIVLEWENLMARRRKRREMVKYGIRPAEKPAEAEAEEEVEAEEEPASEGMPVEVVRGATPYPYPAPEPLADGQTQPDQPVTAPEAPMATAPGQQPGSPGGGRRQRRRKRRHH